MTPPLETREQLLAAVRAARNELDDLVDAADPERLAQPFSIGQWSVKDVIAHLTLWRTRSADRLEAGMPDAGSPVAPWPARFGESETDDEVQAINAWHHARQVATPLVELLQASDVQFERVEEGIRALDEQRLFEARFDWLPDAALGPAVIGGMVEHWGEHAVELRDWLETGT